VITEETYIKRNGKVPMKQNIIRQLAKNFIGQYLSNPSKSTVIARKGEDATAVEMYNIALEYVQNINYSKKLDTRNLEELLLSGAPIQKMGYKYISKRDCYDVYYHNVNPDRIFFNSDISDVRGDDLNFIGEIIDISLDELLSSFARTKQDEEILRTIYRGSIQDDISYLGYGLKWENQQVIDFFTPRHADKCRVFETWYLKSDWRVYAHDYADGTYSIVDYTLKEIETINRKRIADGTRFGIATEDIPLIEATLKKEQFWCIKYLTPTAYCLREMETPYAHQEHPYVLGLYPLVNGEVWGFVEDIIDQQRGINRMVTMLDFIIATSAKNTLMVPETCLGRHTPEDFAREYRRIGGIIVYVPDPSGQMPREIEGASSSVGIKETLSLYLQFIEEISGVHGAIQGQNPGSGTPASRYAMEAQNATLNSLDLMHFYTDFKQERDMKLIKLIKQFYTEKRYLAVAGKNYSKEARIWNPQRVKNIECEVITTQGADTPSYRQLIDDTLMKLLEIGGIDVEMYLENTTQPFAIKILESIKRRKEEMAQGQAGQLPPEVMAEAQQQADPKTLQMMRQAVGRVV